MTLNTTKPGPKSALANDQTLPSPAEVSKAAETDQDKGRPDAFPPEGTDEKTLKRGKDEDDGLSQDVRLKATRAWLAAERARNRKT